MRRVNYNPSTIELPDGWKENVEQLEQELIEEPNAKKRGEKIQENSTLWKDVKHELSKLFNSKCWYTESPQAGTDVDIDHFRPKNRVAETKEAPETHNGYWWLAFKLENYRYSCIVANRRRRDVETNRTGGKSDFFPLWDESKRAWTPECDCDEEQPILLDPCKASDVALITFKEDGEAMPRYAEEQKQKLFLRAQISIDLYNINHSDFKKARIILRDEMSGLVSDAKRYYKKLETGDAAHEYAYEKAISKLLEMRDYKSPYSGFCVSFLDKFRHEEFLDGVFY